VSIASIAFFARNRKRLLVSRLSQTDFSSFFAMNCQFQMEEGKHERVSMSSMRSGHSFSATGPYTHIDRLLTQVVDWALIERHWQDMMQVVLSIQAGKVLPSMLLQRLGVYSRQNTLYKAFSELGRVERTIFLLEYMANTAMRQHIRAETTKVEAYHQFTDWIAFGGPVLRSADPVEQEKRIKYRDLVANVVMLQNVVDMTNVLHDLQRDGVRITPELLACMSPYLTGHLKRFGHYILDMETPPEPLRPKPLFVTVP
jgi:Tn3 transposase DDE domain-containing protein